MMMDDGYARACGKVRVCSVHQGPGFTNTLTGLTEAAKSRTPLLVLSPGVDTECSRWIAEESPLVGVGVETVGIDAGAAGDFDPPFPLHYYLLGAGKYGLTQLANPGSCRRPGHYSS